MFRDDAFQDDPADAFEYVLDRPDRGWNYEPSRAEVFKEFAGAVYTTDAEGWLTYYNDAACDLWGFRPVLGKARWCGSWRLYEHDGTPVPHDESPMAVALRTGAISRGQRCSWSGRTAPACRSSRARPRCATRAAPWSPARTCSCASPPCGRARASSVTPPGRASR